MRALFPDEINPLLCGDETKIRMNFTNNIRWLYIDLYDSGKVRNVKEFAMLCNTPQSTVESWLRRDVIPKPEKRRIIERTFNLSEGSLMNEIRHIIEDWSLEYYNRNGAKPTLRSYCHDEDELQTVAETNNAYDRSAKRDIKLLCNELMKYNELINGNKTIREIITAWKVLIALLLFACENVNFNETKPEPESKPAPVATDTCFAWNGHVVANCEYQDDGYADLLLLSLYEWSELPSANNPEGIELLESLCGNYQENGLSGWHIPSIEEARLLQSIYTDGSQQLYSLNSLMSSIDAMEMHTTEGKENVRYLCDEGLKSFSLVQGTKISNAGAKSRNYNLRLVKCIRTNQDLTSQEDPPRNPPDTTIIYY